MFSKLEYIESRLINRMLFLLGTPNSSHIFKDGSSFSGHQNPMIRQSVSAVLIKTLLWFSTEKTWKKIRKYGHLLLHEYITKTFLQFLQFCSILTWIYIKYWKNFKKHLMKPSKSLKHSHSLIKPEFHQWCFETRISFSCKTIC